MDVNAKGVGVAADRLRAAARNAFEVARFGGLDTREEPSPYEVVHRQRMYRLRHYFPDRAVPGADRPAVLLVPPMMLAADVFDVSPATSGVAILADLGIDPWVIDFGAPEREEGGLDRTLTDHVVALSEALDQVRDAVGADVHLSGYSQGGMFCYQTAAYRGSKGIASVVTFGSPVDTRGMIPFGLPEEPILKVLSRVAESVPTRTPLPAWASRTGFRLLDPVGSLRQRIDFARQLHDRDALLPRERQRRFLQNDGWVAWPGPAIAELLEQIVVHNRMLSGGFVIEGQTVTLADVTCPVLCFVGDSDEIARARNVRSIRQAAPVADVYEVHVPAGHFGLVVGSGASARTWPAVAGWLHWRAGSGALPETVTQMPDWDGSAEAEGPPGSGLVEGIGLAAELGVAGARTFLGVAGRSLRTLRSAAEDAAEQLPRLARLERVRPTSRISAGLLLDEHAARTPTATVFLFEGRGHTYEDAKRRIDAVVRGLISIGVRQGEHVGVLMSTRPSALTAIVALNRMGAVAVLLRPDGHLDTEVALGQVSRIVTDPERAATVADLGSAQVCVLGGGAAARDLGPGVIDMERIDPEAVPLPDWYAPNPGQARDLAFVFFTGEGSRTRTNRVTNGRWALSAFGTAAAASLSARDTVYGLAPFSHPAGLLTAFGGAVGGGARLAMASTFDASTFWDEVRRYGVTAVSYTWTLAHDLVEAPIHPLERHHSVRLFLGSGMPTGLWRRVLERFEPAKVLEFYASTEGAAVLANVSGVNVGAKGRRLPGAAEVAIAAVDLVDGRLLVGPDGFARACRDGEVGMLLARVDHDSGSGVTALRGVFARGDAWLDTGDLFSRDADGDHWLAGHITQLVRTAAGPVPPVPVEDRLGSLAAVDLVVAYGVRTAPAPAPERLVAAVTLVRGATLGDDDLDAALADLEPSHRPEVVRVVEAIPKTTWHRLLSAPLRAEGVPASTVLLPVWGLDPDGRYRTCTEAEHDQWPTDRSALGPHCRVGGGPGARTLGPCSPPLTSTRSAPPGSSCCGARSMPVRCRSRSTGRSLTATSAARPAAMPTSGSGTSR